MKKKQSLKLNFIMNIILTMSSIIFPLITFPYVSRILLPEGTGKISFATSVITYFTMFAQLGIPTYGVRACAKVRDDYEELSKTVHELFLINIVMCTITYFVFFLTLFNVTRLEEEKELFLVMSVMILLNSVGMEWLYKGLEQYTYITIRSVIFKVIALVAMFLLVHQKEDYIFYGGISVFSACASNICNLINAHKYVSIRLLKGYKFKRHFKAILVFFAMSCATTVYTHMDTLMLGFMKSDIDVGYYNAAVKVKTLLVSIVTSLGVVLLPRASYYYEKGLKNEFYRITKKAMNFVVLLSIPMTFYFILFARESIYFLSGSAYEGSIIPMQIIMPTLFFIGMTNITGIQILIPMGKEKYVLYSEIAGAIVDLILNILLIPKFASAGAAIGTIAAEISVWIVQCIAMKEIIGSIYKGIRYKLVGVGVLLGAIGAGWVKYIKISSFGMLVVSACLFFGSYAVVLTIGKEKLTLEIEQQVIGKVLSVFKRNLK